MFKLCPESNFYARLWPVHIAIFSRYTGRLATSVIFVCRLVLYLYACAVEILKFQDSVYQKSE